MVAITLFQLARIFRLAKQDATGIIIEDLIQHPDSVGVTIWREEKQETYRVTMEGNAKQTQIGR